MLVFDHFLSVKRAESDARPVRQRPLITDRQGEKILIRRIGGQQLIAVQVYLRERKLAEVYPDDIHGNRARVAKFVIDANIRTLWRATGGGRCGVKHSRRLQEILRCRSQPGEIQAAIQVRVELTPINRAESRLVTELIQHRCRETHGRPVHIEKHLTVGRTWREIQHRLLLFETGVGQHQAASQRELVSDFFGNTGEGGEGDQRIFLDEVAGRPVRAVVFRESHTKYRETESPVVLKWGYETERRNNRHTVAFGNEHGSAVADLSFEGAIADKGKHAATILA